MQTGVTETIWHFAGYLHLIDEVARSWTLYRDAPPLAPVDELPRDDAALPRAGEIDEIYSRPSPFWAAPGQPIFPEPMLLLRGSPHADVDRPEIGSFHLPEPTDAGLGMGGGSSVTITIRYTFGYRAPIEREEAFGETVAEIRQVNVLNDSDVFVWGEDLASGLLPVDPVDALLTLLDAVRDATPDALAPPTGQAEIGDILVARHQALVDGGEDPTLAEFQAQPGRWVNGEQVGADWELAPFEGAPLMPEGRNGHEAYGAHAHLGGNEATNVAIIQDLNELSLQTIVFGDWYTLDAIVQINAIMDVDALTTFGAQMASTAASLASGGDVDWGGGNRLTNIAEFLEEDVDLGALELPGRGGLQWTIDVLDGDFWDVKAIYQTNWIVDDDLYSKTTYEYFSQVRLGENVSFNLVDFFQAVGDYDLIVIGGNYYAANWIVQANVLLDSDGVLLGHLGGGGVQSGATGQNQLTNDALIAHYGGGGFQALDGDLAAFVQRLMTDDTIDPTDWWDLNGVGSGAMRVLYVTGDYYDVNLISQLNVVSDADALAQVLPADAVFQEDGAEQWVATGGNALVNQAIIVDTGSVVATHVGGDVYEEDFLVQAEIVIDDADYEDDALASEVVAFTGGADVGTDDDDIAGAAPLAGQGDVMGSMMT
ncbi:hypothetical protein ACTZWW_06435 [Salinarimonas sp. NSM]|uniref:hypothetical protein n=1 Tax=Salinarimonas sp. NSM TaxID=3458003 RepID=UPI0040350797